MEHNFVFAPKQSTIFTPPNSVKLVRVELQSGGGWGLVVLN
jgi:hypothetical protein